MKTILKAEELLACSVSYVRYTKSPLKNIGYKEIDLFLNLFKEETDKTNLNGNYFIEYPIGSSITEEDIWQHYYDYKNECFYPNEVGKEKWNEQIERVKEKFGTDLVIRTLEKYTKLLQKDA